MTTIYTLVNPNDLTTAQQIFTAFYAIFFGLMLQTIGVRRTLPDKKENKKLKKNNPQKYNPYISQTDVRNASLNLFDTPNAWAIGNFSKDNKPLWRTVLAIFCLNIFPGYLFAVLFIQFGKITEFIGVWQIVAIVWISLAPHWIYRVFYAVLTKFYNTLYITSEDVEENFNDFDIAAVAMLWEDRLQFQAHKNPCHHIAFPLFVYLPTFLLAYTYFFNKFNCILISCSVMLIVIGFILLIFCTNSNSENRIITAKKTINKRNR